MNEQELQQKIAQKLGVEALSDEKQKALIDKVNEAVLQRVFFATVEKLGAEDRDTLMKNIDDEASTPEQIDAFLREAIVDYDSFVAATVDRFFDEMQQAVEDGAADKSTSHAA